MNNFTFDIVFGDRKKPVYEQLYTFISGEIKNGSIGESEKLPSKKSLAAHLKISPNTVETAYYMLMQEGYIYSKPRSGYYAAKLDLTETSQGTETDRPEQSTAKAYKYDFRTNAVDTSSFPFKTWAKLGREVLYSGENLLSLGDPRGDIELRESLCKYLREFRAVSCRPSQLVIGAGIEYLLMLLNRLFPRDTVFAFEDPGYKKASAVLRGGRELVFLPLDKDGLMPENLYASKADTAYITPSHHFPTGVIMPVGRRQELLKWANADKRRYIIEDDYNNEFNFVGKPIPSMQGMDGSKVIYMSTFSRILTPSVRISYMVLPQVLVELAKTELSEFSSTVSRFEQHTLDRFIRGGYFGRHINRVKTLYRKRKEFLVEQLRSYLTENKIAVRGENAGLHLLLDFPEKDAETFFSRAEANSVKVYRLSDYYEGSGSGGESTAILGYAGMDKCDIENAVKLLFADTSEL